MGLQAKSLNPMWDKEFAFVVKDVFGDLTIKVCRKDSPIPSYVASLTQCMPYHPCSLLSYSLFLIPYSLYSLFPAWFARSLTRATTR